jgi:hypothetical protein
MKRIFETPIVLRRYINICINKVTRIYWNMRIVLFLLLTLDFYFHFERKFLLKESKSVSIFNWNRPLFLIRSETQSRSRSKCWKSVFGSSHSSTKTLLTIFSFFKKHFIDINEESDCGIIHGHPCELFRVFLNGLSFVLLHLYSSSSSFFLLSFVVRLLLVSLLHCV